MTHIKLVTTKPNNIVETLPTTTTQRIIHWNRERNQLKFDIDLETQMLTEEANEFYQATTLVDRIDAWCDFVFVGTGTIIKFLNTRYKGFCDLKEEQENVDKLAEWMESQRVQMIELIAEEINEIHPKSLHDDEIIPEILNNCLDLVVEANEKKGTAKDENGKVIKHPDFVKPEKKIDSYLKKVIGGKYISSF